MRLKLHETLKRLTIVAGLAVVLFIWIQIIRTPRGDFPRNWEFGRRFASGEFLYAGGLHVPYPPAWAMANAPLTLLPAGTAQSLVFPLGVGALALILYLTRKLCEQPLPLGRRHLEFWTTALVLLLTSRFIIRDLFEAGPNLLLLALTWSAVYLWLKRRSIPAGVCLGVAAALKCTPAILWGYFLLKRQWKMLLVSCATALSVTLAPAFFMGIPAYSNHMQVWARVITPGFIETDPSRAILGQSVVQNLALKQALADVFRWGLPDRADNSKAPATSEPGIRGITINLLIAVFLLWMGWRFRSAVSLHSPFQPCCECAAMLILGLLLSPITWIQHCVAAIPAVYLLVRRALSERTLDGFTGMVLACYLVFVLFLNRTFIGRDLTLLLYGLHTITWIFAALLLVMLRCIVIHHQGTKAQTGWRVAGWRGSQKSKVESPKPKVERRKSKAKGLKVH